MAIQSRQGSLPPILLTRPAAQADRFANALRRRFGAEIRIVSSPLLAPRLLSPLLPDGPFRAVVFTSETAVVAYSALSPPDRGLAWCVGDATAAAARAAGFEVRSAGGDAATLLAAIRAAGTDGPLLHARGREVAANVADALNSAGIETFEAVVYSQEPQPLGPAARELLDQPGPVLLPLFSPRSATLLSAIAASAPFRPPLWIAAMSPAVAWAADALRPGRLEVARHPDAGAMVDAIAALLAQAAEP